MAFCLREPHVKAADCHSTSQPDVDSSDSPDAGAAVSSEGNSVTECSVLLADFCGWRCQLWRPRREVGRVALSVSRAVASHLDV